MTLTVPEPVTAAPAPGLRLLQAAGFVSNFDRFCIAPILVVIASRFGVPVHTVVLAASGYYLAYGLMQPVWGAAGDRWGRVRVLRISLAGAAPDAWASALAPSTPVLIGARAATGGFFAASIAACLTYVGDTVPAAVRQRPLSALMSAFAAGTAAATLVAGVSAHLLGWRPVLALPGFFAAYLAVARRLPEPEPERSGSLLAPFRVVLRSRWQWYVMAVALLAGAVLLGFLTYLAPALEAHGAPASLVGAVASLHGHRPLPGHFAQGARRMAGLGLSDHASNDTALLAALSRLTRPGPERDLRIARGRQLFHDEDEPLTRLLAAAATGTHDTDGTRGASSTDG
ncbi:MFS transporter [Streptomyces griseofuscus]|uniref:MFS transporter n=1 Tax=Streptomyces griseofuscus TaxID=146922 RepID=UPI00368F3BE5